jgi:hypothetical protein
MCIPFAKPSLRQLSIQRFFYCGIVVASLFVFSGTRTAIAEIKQTLLKNVREKFRVSYWCVKAKNRPHIETRHCVKETLFFAFLHQRVFNCCVCCYFLTNKHFIRSLFLVSLYSGITEKNTVDIGHLLNPESEFASLSIHFRWHLTAL